MSCPDWAVLVAARERNPQVEPAGWSEARAHLGECPRCRETALTLDPVLFFLRLSPSDRGPGGEDEVAAMRQGVAALIRAGRVADHATRRPAVAKRVAAAAALVVAALALDPAPSSSPRVTDEARAWAVAMAQLPDQPLIDELDLSQARVYELGSDGMAVVMVVDANLDV